jgi:hypothetical protein
MAVCPVCHRESALPLTGSGPCDACANRPRRSLHAAGIATELCGKPPRLAVWWQGVTRSEIPPDEVRLGRLVTGGVLLGPAGIAVGLLAGGANRSTFVYSAGLGVIAVEDEAVWIFQCASLYLGESGRLEDHHIASMLKAWEEGGYAPETTRIPANQVSCHADAPSLVLKYGPRSWRVQVCAPQLAPGQPGLTETVQAILGGVTVPPIREFMKRLVSSGPPPEPGCWMRPRPIRTT